MNTKTGARLRENGGLRARELILDKLAALGLIKGSLVCTACVQVELLQLLMQASRTGGLSGTADGGVKIPRMATSRTSLKID